MCFRFHHNSTARHWAGVRPLSEKDPETGFPVESSDLKPALTPGLAPLRGNTRERESQTRGRRRASRCESRADHAALEIRERAEITNGRSSALSPMSANPLLPA